MRALTDFDLKLLRVFKAVTDSGGLSTAESVLNMNLSMISTYLSDLEQRLGLKLCDRGRKGFQLTSEGRLLYQALDVLLMSVEDFRGEVGKIKNQINGELSIGIVDNTLSDPRLKLSHAIATVKEGAGGLFVKLEIKSPQEIEAALLNRGLNIGIGPFRKQHPQLVYQTLYEETLNLYCGSGHPLFRAGAASLDLPLDQLRGQEYVSRGYLREAKIYDYMENFHSTATVQNMEAVAALILSGKFIGFLPEHYASQWVGMQRMQSISPALFSHTVPFCTARRKDMEAALPVQAFLSALYDTTA